LSKHNPYSAEFFEDLRGSSSKSAKIIAQFILNKIKPKSVVDFGCGTGELLKALESMGKIDCLGIEGPWIEGASRVFRPIAVRDLTNIVTLGKKFDVAVCLEVGEHLGEQFSTNLIASLTNASDIIVFSAAIPGQNGTDHVNLQFPEYWAKLFWERSFALWLDPRHEFFQSFTLAPWYQQNTLVFKKISHNFYPKEFISPKTIYHPLIFPKKHPIKNFVYRARARINVITSKDCPE